MLAIAQRGHMSLIGQSAVGVTHYTRCLFAAPSWHLSDLPLIIMAQTGRSEPWARALCWQSRSRRRPCAPSPPPATPSISSGKCSRPSADATNHFKTF